MSGHLLRPCKSTAVFEALPWSHDGGLQLDLTTSQSALESIGYQEVCNAKVLIIMKKDIEVTIYPNGKLIIKTDSKVQAEFVMNEIYDQLLIR
ncbi:hypothetical protein [[Eubacterium] cellulosolvens]